MNAFSIPKIHGAVVPAMRANAGLRAVVAFLLLLLALTVRAEDYAAKIAPLIDPAKLATLGERGANPRVQRCVYWLEMARRDEQKPATVLDRALRSVGVTNQAAELTKAALLRNLTIAERLGCLNADGLDEMKHGKSPTVQRGPYKGDQLSVDHIIPRAVCPELDNVIGNLELMPARMNSGKRDAVGDRQVELARKLNRAGLLSASGVDKVRQAVKRHWQ